ncbi:MAG: PqqD family protein [Chloroflexi bacterium]|nr:PqqD family protein [Chloroflexota bacterium]
MSPLANRQRSEIASAVKGRDCPGFAQSHSRHAPVQSRAAIEAPGFLRACRRTPGGLSARLPSSQGCPSGCAEVVGGHLLTLDALLHIPANVSFSVVGEDAFLLNTQTNKYFSLEKVGTRLWELLSQGRSLREAYQRLLKEYEVSPAELESDLLELVNHMMENGLVEIVSA